MYNVTLNEDGVSSTKSFARVHNLLDFAFGTFEDFSQRLGNSPSADARRTEIDRARQRSVLLHDARAKGLRLPVGFADNSRVALSSDPLFPLIVNHDNAMRVAGFHAVIIDQAIFSLLGFAGSPDVVWYRPPINRQREILVVSDLKLSKSMKPLQENSRPCEQFAFTFRNISDIHDTLFHKAGMQLNAYAYIVQDGYLDDIRQFFGVVSDQPPELFLDLVVVHDELDGQLSLLRYPVRTQAFGALLDTWLLHEGHLIVV